MAEWWSIEVFSSDKLPASQWRYAYEDVLTEAAVTHGALYWDWYDSQYGVVFEVCFATDEQWAAFRDLPTVRGALDAVPDPVSGLLIYRGRGGAAGRASRASPSPPRAPPHWSLRSRRGTADPAAAPQGDRRAAARTARSGRRPGAHRPGSARSGADPARPGRAGVARRGGVGRLAKQARLYPRWG